MVQQAERSFTLSPRLRMAAAVLGVLALLAGLALLQTVRATEGNATPYQSLQTPLVHAALVFALGALLTGTWAIASIRYRAWRSKASRAHLMHHFVKAQRALPWLLLCLIIAIFGSAIVSACFEFVDFMAQAQNGRPIGMLSAMFALVTALVLLSVAAVMAWRLFGALHFSANTSVVHVAGTAVSAIQAPKVWNLVHQVTTKMKAPLPHFIVIGLAPSFWVSNAPQELSDGTQIADGQRTLYLSLTLMAFLNKRELASIIAHELAHFAGQDTQAGKQYANMFRHAENSMRLLDNQHGEIDLLFWLQRPGLWLGAYLLCEFDLLTSKASRIDELLADKAAVKSFGAEACACSLLRSSALISFVYQAIDDAWQAARKAEPADVLAHLRALVNQHGLPDAKALLTQNAATNPYDSHPSDYDRIKAMGLRWSNELAQRVSDKQPSRLLEELGLESVPSTAFDTFDKAAPSAEMAHPDTTPGLSAASTVHHSLQKDFAAAARQSEEIDHERIPHLKELAEYGMGTEELHERIWLPLIGTGLVAVGMAFVLATQRRMAFWESAACLLIFLGCLVAAWVLYRRGQSPALTLTRTGAKLGWPSDEALVEWPDIVDFDVYSGVDLSAFYTTMTLEIQLAGYAARPNWRNGLRCRYDRSRHRIVLSMQGLQELDAEGLAELFQTYWHAGLARNELRHLQL